MSTLIIKNIGTTLRYDVCKRGYFPLDSLKKNHKYFKGGKRALFFLPNKTLG